MKTLSTFISILLTSIISINVSFSVYALPLAGYEDVVRTNFQSEENPFVDVNINDPKGIAAIELYRRGVIGGFSDGTFRTNTPVNRAEAAKFLMLAKPKGFINIDKNVAFWDAAPNEWYYEYIVQASESGIIDGYSDGSFRPGKTIIRAEFIKMISLTFNLDTDLEHSYLDTVEYPNAWFWKYAGGVQKYNLFPNLENKLNPTEEITRGEVALAIYQYLKNRTENGKNTEANNTENAQNKIDNKDLENQEFTQEDYGYSLIYPKNYKISSNLQQPNENLNAKILHSFILQEDKSENTNESFEIAILNGETFTTEGTNLVYLDTITVNGLEMKRYKEEKKNCDFDECLKSKITLFFSKGGNHHLISYDQIPKNQSAYESILDSLNFNDTGSTNITYKEHSNSTYGYSLKYPSNYKISTDVQQPNENLYAAVLHSFILEKQDSKYSNANFEITVLKGETYSKEDLGYGGTKNINGTEVEQYEKSFDICDNSECFSSLQMVLIFTKGGNHYVITHDLLPENANDYNTILDSLLF